MQVGVALKWSGKLCPNCPGSDKCKRKFTKHTGWRFDGVGFDDWELNQCPAAYVTEDIWHVITLAGFYKQGLPPVAGGVLDQTAIFIAAAEFIWHEEQQYKAE